MYYWKDISSPKLFSLTNQILRKYGEEELINFYLSKCKQTIEEIKVDYENGKSLQNISNDNNLIIISALENHTKNKKSSITKEELLFLIENNKM